MTDTQFEFPYDPTLAEVRQGMMIVRRTIYAGGWKWAAMLYSLLHGAGIAALGFLFAFMVMGWMGVALAENPYLYFGLFVGFAAAFLAFQRAVSNRSAVAYLGSPWLQGQCLGISARGLQFENGRSQGLTDWRDFSGIVEHKGMLVLALGNQGLILPARIVAAHPAGSDAVATAIRKWFDAARGVPR